MNEPENMPRLPERYLEAPARKLGNLKPGEQAVVNLLFDVHVDQESRVWITDSASVKPLPPLPGMTALVERTEAGFILWLDKKATFTRRELGQSRRYMPVVELRESAEENT